MAKTAVVLLNLGGPDGPDAVRPFLVNLFSDPAIIGVPGPVRWALARYIARRRAPVAREISGRVGGGSPLLANTRLQAEALEKAFPPEDGTRVFVAMRYWRPRSREVARQVKVFGAEEVVLLPLYPQFSTATTASSVADWRQAARAEGLEARTKAVCCYPVLDGFVDAVAVLMRPALAEAAGAGRPRVLFSAHGLPKRIVARGDPYQWQVERTAAAVVERLASPDLDWAGLDWQVCYQSRVGRLEWIGPEIKDELKRAAADRVPVVVVPISFVSEHSETLVELDMMYRELAAEFGVPRYVRAATVADAGAFIGGLADLVGRAWGGHGACAFAEDGGVCPAAFGGCPRSAGAG